MIYMAGDLHLIRYIWREKQELDGDSYRALHAMVDAIVKDKTNEKKLLLLAGDNFDRNRIDGRTLDEFTKAVDKLSDNDVMVAFVQGQHDRNDPPHAQVQGAVWLHNRTITFDDRKIAGLDWHCRDDLHEALKNVPECDILVMHQSFEHMIGYGMAADLELADVPKHVKNILVGDIHVQELQEHRKGWCLSPGPLHPCNISQGGQKCFWKLSYGSNKPEGVFIPTRPIWRIRATEDATLTEMFESEVDIKGSSLAPIV